MSLPLRVTASAVFVVLVSGCSNAALGGARAAAPPSGGAPSIRSQTKATSADTDAWADATRAPWPAAPIGSREATLADACGGGDGALARAARLLVDERARGLGVPDPDRVTSVLRRLGAPYVRPRSVTASGRAPLDDDALRAELAALGGPRRRCGVAFARTPQDKELLVAVVVDAVADLAPIPIRARTGAWLSFAATLHVPATGAKLVLLGPRGLPRTAPTSFDRATRAVRARFVLDRPGPFTLQLIADTEGGPRPVLEARAFADTEPTERASPAPGEEPLASDADALERMTATLRASESLPPLARDARLDALAHAHVEQMIRAGRLAHDLGDGDLSARLQAAGLSAALVGENVARADTVTLAHRALHASPSHRLNLLHARYTNVGFAALAAPDGRIYVCEVFTTPLE